MTEDSRSSSRPDGDTATVPSGDGGIHVALSLRDEETLSLDEIEVEYDDAGSTNSVLEVHDEDENINSGDEDNLVDRFYLTPGDRVNPDMVYPDVENDIVVTTAGNQDAEITVTVGGHIVTG